MHTAPARHGSFPGCIDAMMPNDPPAIEAVGSGLVITKALQCPMASGRVDVAGRFVEVETMSLASNATLAESFIVILLWNFPLKSRFYGCR